jgi:hypothetical protein
MGQGGAEPAGSQEEKYEGFGMDLSSMIARNTPHLSRPSAYYPSKAPN